MCNGNARPGGCSRSRRTRAGNTPKRHRYYNVIKKIYIYNHTNTKGGASLYNIIRMYNVQYNVCIMGPYSMGQAAVNRQNGNGKTRRVHNNQSSTVERLQPAEFSSRLTLDGASRRRRSQAHHVRAPFV